jgi:outer membrane protein TolC
MEVLESMREAISAKQMTAQVQKVQMDTEAQLFKALGGEQSLSDRKKWQG